MKITKDRTVCRSCYNKNRKNNTLIKNQQPKIDNVNRKISLPEKRKHDNNPRVSAYENHSHVIIGPRNVGKTYYMLKILEKIGNERPIHIITRSPNQYPNYKTSNEIKPIDKYTGSVLIFDDMLGARYSSQINEFLREEDMKI